MATTNTTVTAVFCQPNEGHVTLTAPGLGSVKMDTSDLAGVPTNAEVAAAIMVLCRFHVRALSAANKKAAAVSGIALAITSTP